MIGKIFRYTFIALVFIAIFCFIFKLDDIVGGMPIKAKATSVTIPKKTSKTITAPETVKPVAGSTNATVVGLPTATPATDTPVETPPAPSTTTPAQTQAEANGKCFSDCTNPNAPSFDLWGNEWSATGTLIQYSSECVDPISGQVNPYNPSCTQ